MKLKRTITAAGIAAVTLFTAGCMSLTANITLDGQAKASGSMVVSVNKQVASLAGIGSADAFKAQVTEGDTTLPPSAKIETSESDTDYIATVSFKDAVMDDAEFGAEVLENGNVKFTFVNAGSEPTTEDDMFGDVDMGNATLTVNFPGEVTEFSGEGATKVDDDTVKWAFPLTTSTTATATSLVAASSSPVLPVGIGVLALAVLVGAGLFITLRRRTQPEAELAAPDADTDLDSSPAETTETDSPEPIV